MKIGIDLKYIRSGKRRGNLGDELVHRSILRYLPEVDRDNDYSLYLSNGASANLPDRAVNGNITLKTLPLYENRLLRNVLVLPRELRKHPVQVFHGSASLPFSARTKTVVTMWEFSPLMYPEYFTRYVSSTRSYMYRRSVRIADRILTGTQFMKQEIVNFFDIPEDKVVVIPLCLDDRFRRPVEQAEIEATKRTYGIDTDYVLSVGDIYPKKNIVSLISAVAHLKSRGQLHEKLVVVGSALWKSGDCQGIDPRHVHFTGYVDDQHLPALYQGATAFVFPSLYEGFGVPVLEAMASGVPMALSNNTSFPEIALDAAVYFDPTDVDSLASVLRDVVTDQALRQRLRQAEAIRIKSFDWKDIIRRYCDLYARLGQC